VVDAFVVGVFHLRGLSVITFFRLNTTEPTYAEVNGAVAFNVSWDCRFFAAPRVSDLAEGR
jgi:hypothetical protein